MAVRKKTRPLRDEIQALDTKLAAEMQKNDLFKRCLLVEHEHNALKKRLISLLLPEQIEAARTCGIAPEMYALEWIDIHFRDALTKESTLYRIAPSFSGHVHSLKDIKSGAI